MPTYSYACKSCPTKFDVQQSFEDDALTECPECGGTLRKLYGRVGVVFKGSGFYRTDSRGGTSSVPAGSAAKDSTAKEAATPTDSAPAKTTTPSAPSTPAASSAAPPAKAS